MVLYLLLRFEGLASGCENGGDDNHWDGETKEAIQCYFTYIKLLYKLWLLTG